MRQALYPEYTTFPFYHIDAHVPLHIYQTTFDTIDRVDIEILVFSIFLFHRNSKAHDERRQCLCRVEEHGFPLQRRQVIILVLIDHLKNRSQCPAIANTLHAGMAHTAEKLKLTLENRLKGLLFTAVLFSLIEEVLRF